MQVSTTVLWLALLLQAQYLFCMAGPVGVTSEELTEGELKLSGSGEDLVDTLNHIKDEEYINSCKCKHNPCHHYNHNFNYYSIFNYYKSYTCIWCSASNRGKEDAVWRRHYTHSSTERDDHRDETKAKWRGGSWEKSGRQEYQKLVA